MTSPRWSVRLRVVSEVVTPDHLARTIGLEPDRRTARGTIPPRSTLPRRFSSWELESQLDPTADLSEHVGNIVSRLEGRTASLRKAIKDAGIAELAAVAYFTPLVDDNPFINLGPELISFLADLGICLDFEAVPQSPNGGSR